MNRIAKVLSQISDDMLMHYGVARRSGRYPWGSGDNPYQHSGDFLSRVQSLKKSGIAEIFEVDLNLYSPYVKAIDREIGLIKKWRQRDKKMESYFRCKGDV